MLIYSYSQMTSVYIMLFFCFRVICAFQFMLMLLLFVYCLHVHTHAGQDSQDERVAFLQLCSMLLLKKSGSKDVLPHLFEEVEVCIIFVYTNVDKHAQLNFVYIFRLLIDVRVCRGSG